MPPKKAATPIKRGRGRPPKDATSTTNTTASKSTPAKPRGRPLGTTRKVLSKARPKKPSKAPKPTPVNATATPAKKRGRPPGSSRTARPSSVAKLDSSPRSKTPARKSYQSAPKKGSASTSAGVTKAKGGRPRGKHVSNLSSSLRGLIASASKTRLADLLSVLCEKNAVVANAARNALSEGKARKGSVNGEDVKGVVVLVEKEAPEPASGYEADVEPEIPDSTTAIEQGTQAETFGDGDGDGDGDRGGTADGEGLLITATETIAEAVSSVRDRAFGL